MGIRAFVRACCILMFAVVLALAGGTAHAQSAYTVTLSRTLLAPPYPSIWSSSNSFITIGFSNTSGEPILADLTISLSRGGILVGSTPPIPHIYDPGSVLFTTPQVTDWSRMSFLGEVRRSVDDTGRLPDGTYSVCAGFTNVRTASGVPLGDNQSCLDYVVFFPKPPKLIFPENGTIVSVPQPVFQWTPVLSQVGRQLPHWFRMVEVLPGQTAPQAIEANRPVYEALFNNTSAIPYPPSAPLLHEGATYAWRVQSAFPLGGLGPPGGISTHLAPPVTGRRQSPSFSIVDFGNGPVLTFGENDGKSRVFTFTWISDPVRAAALREARAGSAPAPEPDDRVGGRSGGDEAHDGGGNFADDLIHALVSLWRPGHGAASAAVNADPRRVTTPPSAASSQASSADAPDSVAVTPVEPEAAPAEVPAEGTPTTVPPTVQPAGAGPNWARLHGSTSFTGESYSRDGSGYPTRPDQSARVVSGLTVGVVGDRIQVPVSALVSGDQVRYRQNINQLAIAPRWEWAGITAGNLMPQFSSYTLADATILGGGFELNPSRWRLGFASGRARKAITPTTEYPVTPQFARSMTAGRIGYGDPNATSVEVSILRATDDPGSLGGAESTLTITPEENMVYAARLQRVMPARHLRAQFETAFSRYERDRRSSASSLDGQALGLQLFHETGISQVGMKGEYLNGGFKTLGNTGITGDRLELGASARVQMLRGKLALDASAGLQNEGVNTNAIADSRRRSYGLNGSWQPKLWFGTDTQFAIYTSRSDASDSLFQGTSNTTRIASIAPHVSWSYAGIEHSASASVMLQQSRNGSGGTFLNTESLTLFANWALMISQPWTATLSGNYTKTDFDISVSEVSSFAPGFTWAAFRSRVRTNAQVQFVRSRTGNAGIDYDVAPRLETRWEFAPHQAILFRGNYRHFKYGDPATPRFDERTAQLEYVTNL